MKRFALLIGIASLAVGVEAQPAVTTMDLQVVARALSFIEPPMRGTVRVGIVYDAASNASVRQAQEVQRLLTTAVKAANLELRPTLVEMRAADRADVDLLFLTEHVGQDVAAHIAARRIPCVTTDLAQMTNGVCLMGVRAQPKVEIFVNRAAADAAGVSFATVFRMMVKEI